jgi:hypothetical protein
MFLKYVAAVQQEEERAAAYRVYMSDGLYSMGLGHKERYYNMIYKPKKNKTASMSGDDIVNDIIRRHNIKIIEGKEDKKDG